MDTTSAPVPVTTLASSGDGDRPAASASIRLTWLVPSPASMIGGNAGGVAHADLVVAVAQREHQRVLRVGEEHVESARRRSALDERHRVEGGDAAAGDAEADLRGDVD